MDRLRRMLKGEGQEQEYEPLDDSVASVDQEEGDITPGTAGKPTFSWIEYSVFLLLGVSMLWAWNMFLAAGPYFQHRFRGDERIHRNFQAAEISVSTITNLGSMLVLTRLQAGASYAKRIVFSLLINMAVFALLAASTAIDVSARGYFAFLMIMIFSTSLATGLCQNGVFAYVSGFGEPRYTQAIMTGQGIAGVLPCIAQIVSVLSVQGANQELQHPPEGVPPEGPPPPAPVRSGAAFAYFLTAAVIAVATLLAFSYLAARRRQSKHHAEPTSSDSADQAAEPASERKEFPLLTLLSKLRWLALAVFVTFAVTMVFPVFTQKILSVRGPRTQTPLFQPPVFIPLAFLFWNSGDLLGRTLPAFKSLSLVHVPRLVLAFALLRVAWVGLYHLCNIRGEGAIVDSDVFYLVVVQVLFGLTNGYLGSTCMIGAGEWVEPEEREAAGGFMGLCLVGGLTVGSLASFFIAGA